MCRDVILSEIAMSLREELLFFKAGLKLIDFFPIKILGKIRKFVTSSLVECNVLIFGLQENIA